MIFRLSQKLSKKIKVAANSVAPPDENPFADWSAHLFTAQRTRYIILTNTPSLYSMVMLGKGIMDDRRFVDAALSTMREFMVEDGMDFIFQKFIAPTSEEVIFSKALNRSVTGSMNDMVFGARFLLAEEGMSLVEISSGLNETPMSVLGYGKPREAFKGMRIPGKGK